MSRNDSLHPALEGMITPVSVLTPYITQNPVRVTLPGGFLPGGMVDGF